MKDFLIHKTLKMIVDLLKINLIILVMFLKIVKTFSLLAPLHGVWAVDTLSGRMPCIRVLCLKHDE